MDAASPSRWSPKPGADLAPSIDNSSVRQFLGLLFAVGERGVRCGTQTGNTESPGKQPHSHGHCAMTTSRMHRELRDYGVDFDS